MPLNRPALSLGTGPRGVQDARRWVVGTCLDIGRPDLVPCAELGVSELVTNAVLHGQPPIRVRVRGTREHPRVEVRDGSVERPVLPSPLLHGDDDVPLTFGRGLGIVARASRAWGAEIEDDGKVVWFAPASSFSESDGAPGVITGPDLSAVARAAAGDLVSITVVGVPLRAYVGFQRHCRELRREVRLLALAHESDYPLAKDLSDVFATLERHLREGVGVEQVESALNSGRTETDLHLSLSRAAADTLDRFAELLELADEFCRRQRLLSLARDAEQQRFQRWFLGELARQIADHEPGGSPGPYSSGRRSSVS